MNIKSSIEYKIGGRKVSQREWERHLFEQEPKRLIRENVEGKLRGLRCPKHGESPRPTFRETSRGFDLSVSTCCEELEALVQRALH